MSIKNNKKGGEKLISVYWFIILFLVAGAISYMVYSFYGKPYDVRQVEADLLTNKVAECLSKAGYLNEEVFNSEFSENFPESCEITFKGEEEKYYLEMNINDFSSGERKVEARKGNINLKNFCNLKGENLPFCLERSLYLVDKNNNQYRADILSIVGRT